MKRIIITLLFPLALAVAAGCVGDDITTTDDSFEEAEVVDCDDLNADVTVLQGLIAEYKAASTVTGVSGSAITFDSGTTLTVTVRSAYGFAYVNPSISYKGDYWTLDGSTMSLKVASTAPSFKIEDGVWYVYYNSAWNSLGEAVEGSSVPVFKKLSSSDSNVTITLAGGDKLSFDTYVGSDSCSLSGYSASIAQDGGSASVTVTSSEGWTATASEDWLSVSATSGASGDSVTITAADNSSGASRSGYVTFTAGSVSAKFTVSQAGESGGGTISGGDTETSDDNIANTTFDRTIYVTYSSGSASVSGAGDNQSVSVSGAGVTITNSGTENIIYQLSGSTTNGYFKLYSSKKQAIYLSGVSITNPSGAAINNQSGKRTFVYVTGTNYLSDSSSATYSSNSSEQEKGVFFSEGQLIFSGDGALTVAASNAKSKNGIVSDDYVRFMSSPTVTVTCGSGAGHGVKANDAIVLSNGTVNVTTSAAMKKCFTSDSLVTVTGGAAVLKASGGTAYDSEDSEYKGSACIKADYKFSISGGTLTLTNSGKGGKGLSGDGTAEFNGGTVNISVTGSNNGTKTDSYESADYKGAKGVKFDGAITINDGTLTVSASNNEAIEGKSTITVNGGSVYAYSSGDDAINSASHFTITGGYVCGWSTANDGLDANGNMYINGGVVYAVTTKGSPEVAIDANTEKNYYLYIKGGTVLAYGGLENNPQITGSGYQASLSTSYWYGVSASSSSAASTIAVKPLVSGTHFIYTGGSQSYVFSGVSTSGGTSIWNSHGVIPGTVSGGSSVSLSSYSGSGGGGNQPGGGGPGGNPGGGPGGGKGW